MTYAQILQKYSRQIYEEFYPPEAKAICLAHFHRSVRRGNSPVSDARRHKCREIRWANIRIFCPLTINFLFLILLHPKSKKTENGSF